MPTYRIEIEVAAMNRPLDDAELLKALVSGFCAWKTTRRTAKPAALYTLMFGAFGALGFHLTSSSFSKRQDKSNSSRLKFEFLDIDPNNLLLYFGNVAKHRDGVCFLSYFCKKFKCAAKTTVTDESGCWTCDYCLPDGREEREEGKAGKSQRSLDEFGLALLGMMGG